MPSNELTWALYGMAIVAAPIVAVWLWRRLGRRKRHKLGREVAPGWYMDFDDSTVGDMRIEPAPKETYCEVRCNLCGTRMAAVGTNRDEGSTIYECDNPACVNQVIIEPAKKPAPYSESAKALGSKPDAPWVTREEILEWREQIEKSLDDLHDSVDALEAKEPKATTPFFMDASSSGTLRYTLHCVDPATSIDEALKRIDAKEPEAGRGGYRVFAKSDFTWVWDGGSLYVRSDTWPWTPSGYLGITQLYEQIAGVFELHGKDADRIVAEFLEWRGK